MTALEFIRLLFKCSSSVEVRKAVLRTLGMSYTLVNEPDQMMSAIEKRLSIDDDNYGLYKPVLKSHTFQRTKNSREEEFVGVVRIGEATISCSRKEYGAINVPDIVWEEFEQLEAGEKTIEEVYARDMCQM